MEITVRHEPEHQRYVAVVDGRDVGVAQYVATDAGTRTFTHTVVDPAVRGRGVAAALVEHAVRDVREHGMTVVATCTYVQSWLAKHPEALTGVADVPAPDTD